MSKYYSLKNILKTNAVYYMIIGGRSNGKTYAVQEYALKQFWKTGKQLAIIRRYRDDFTGARGMTMFANQVNTGNVSRITSGIWDDITYYRSAWYLCKHMPDGEMVKSDIPFAYAFSISSMEHDKSTSYPNIMTVLFDEFLTRDYYLTDEFILFMNVLSTIIRHRDGVKIFMVGNTVNKYCPYFTEMGITHVKNMKPGQIDLYRYGDSDLSVAVEYSENRVNSKTNETYFAFSNPKLSMITGNEWEIDMYPHCPVRYKPKHIMLMYFIEFNHDILQCDIVATNGTTFTFVHRKTSDIKHPDSDIVFSPEYDCRMNHIRNICKPSNDACKRIYDYYVHDNVYYQDNEVGEIVANYLKWCRKES